MTTTMLTTPTATTATPSVVRTDERAHIEDTPLFTAIRNHRFMELPWNALTESEQRAIYVNMFNPNGF